MKPRAKVMVAMFADGTQRFVIQLPDGKPLRVLGKMARFGTRRAAEKYLRANQAEVKDASRVEVLLQPTKIAGMD